MGISLPTGVLTFSSLYHELPTGRHRPSRLLAPCQADLTAYLSASQYPRHLFVLQLSLPVLNSPQQIWFLTSSQPTQQLSVSAKFNSFISPASTTCLSSFGPGYFLSCLNPAVHLSLLAQQFPASPIMKCLKTQCQCCLQIHQSLVLFLT